MCNCSGCCARGPQGPSETSKVYFEEYNTATAFATPYTSAAILAAGVLTFTITAAGTYRITAPVNFNAPSSGATIRSGVEKNGTVLGNYIDVTTATNTDIRGYTFLKEETLAVGDVISVVFGYTSGTAPTNLTSSLLIEKLNN